jgi:hypothetical protein
MMRNFQKQAAYLEATFLQHVIEKDVRKFSSTFSLMKITTCGFRGMAALIAIHLHVKLINK